MNRKTIFKTALILTTVGCITLGLKLAEEYVSRPKHQHPAVSAIEYENYQTAANEFSKEAKQGSPIAQWAYAELIDMDMVAVVQPKETAAALYQKAAIAGFRPAQIKLAQVQPGLGDFTEYKKHAARLLHIRAMYNDASASLELAQWYLKRTQKDQAFFWIKKAIADARPDDPVKLYASHSLFYDFGGEKEQRQALEVMRGFVERIDREPFMLPAYIEFAAMLESAQCRLRNGWEAYKWYRLAADKGSSAAQARLGVAYIEGDLIGMQSEYEGLKWLKKAAAPRINRGGYAKIPSLARLVLLHYLAKGIGGQLDKAEALNITASELEYFQHEDGGIDLDKSYYAVAIGIRKINTEFVRTLAADIAKNGSEECTGDSRCMEEVRWFQLLAGESRKVLAARQALEKSENPLDLFHLGHALLIQGQLKEAEACYLAGIDKATRRELFRLDDELDLLGWHFSRSHSLFTAAWMFVNDYTKLRSEDELLKDEEVKSFKSLLSKDGLIKEPKP